MTPAFVGFIIVPLVGGVSAMPTAFSGARKNRLDLSIGIALGSSIQIALFVAPMLVIMSLFVGPSQLNLNFPRPLIVGLFLAVILAAMVAGDGRSNWYKGVQLIIVYLIKIFGEIESRNRPFLIPWTGLRKYCSA